MAASVTAALLCDDIRQEDNGKFLLIGTYTGVISFPRFPAAGNFSMLCCIQSEEETSGQLQVRFKLNEEVVGDINGNFVMPASTAMWAPIALPPVSFPGESVLTAEAQINGDNNWVTFFRMPAKKEVMNS